VTVYIAADADMNIHNVKYNCVEQAARSQRRWSIALSMYEYSSKTHADGDLSMSDSSAKQSLSQRKKLPSNISSTQACGGDHGWLNGAHSNVQALRPRLAKKLKDEHL